MSKDNIYIGYITKTHGLYGLFSIKLDGSPRFCEACLNIKKLYFEDDMSLNVKHLKLNSKIFLKTQVSEINTREQAKEVLRKNIYIKKGEVVEIDQIITKENRLLNFQVIDNQKNVLGLICKIDYNRLQPMMTIKNKNKEILAPFIKNFIKKIDEENKILFVDFPEGLVEICHT